ncbi:MAG: aldehyde dehydrogenase family protein [Nanoarchaeota archaeon]|nr:aldehyde dehydrogenase family protein [Nanoarchaeota archaeon]MBU2520047.1 aldehyde dehydrogenase family protein [Nanoarchaeota archaeon]
MIIHKNFIDGKWVKSSSGKTFESINPATGKTIGCFQSGNERDVNNAVLVAETAFKKWSDVPAPKRGEILFHAAHLLRKEKERLAQLVTKEMGKVVYEARGDVQEAIDITEYMAGEGRRLFGHTTKSELRDKFAMTIKRPVGVCGLISPWNFPIAIPAWKIMPALICGNTVVFKPASDAPLSAIEFVKILIKAGVPKGVLNLITGPGSTVGMPIVKHKKIPCISFTGSRETGETILKEAGVKKIGLELGGKNGIIIMDDADLNLAIDGVLWGAFGTTGQRCTATSRAMVHRKVKRKFERKLVDRTKKLRVDNGLKSSTDVGPLINLSAVEKTHMYVDIGRFEGAKLLCGGERPKGKGFFYKPTIFTNVTSDMRIAKEEIFGPVLSIIEIKNLDEAIDVMNGIEYGLSSAIYTKNMKNAFNAIDRIETGLTYVNSSTIGSEVHLPFGGVKKTGSTREAGIEGINEFSETKTVYFDYSGRLQKAQIDVVR